jgi:hypothetical protein
MNDPHDREYAAAVSYLPEHTISPKHEPAVGDFVSGTTAGKRWSGHVEWVEDGRVCINVDGGWIAVPVSDITH